MKIQVICSGCKKELFVKRVENSLSVFQGVSIEVDNCHNIDCYDCGQCEELKEIKEKNKKLEMQLKKIQEIVKPVEKNETNNQPSV